MTETPRPSFVLNGPSIDLDSRTHAVRGDLADIALAGKHFVPHYAKPMAMICRAACPVHAEASSASEGVAKLPAGATFMAVDLAGGWAWGFCADTHLVGYAALDHLEQAK
ncbi:MAG: SH3 domain-containing protein [Chakrabartia sp.]